MNAAADSSVNYAAELREIGRGPKGSRPLSMEAAQALWKRVLEGQVPELELGGLLLALRMKGESPDEMHGFLSASHAAVPRLRYRLANPCVVIASYSGTRRRPNLVPLLAMLLRARGITALVHGEFGRPALERITTDSIFHSLGYVLSATPADLLDQLEHRGIGLISIDALHAPLAGVLRLRQRLGVRNSAHSLVKLIQPLDVPAARLASFTHPEYESRMRHALQGSLEKGPSLLVRALEGEAALLARNAVAMECIDSRGATVCSFQSDEPPEPDAWSKEMGFAELVRYTQAVADGAMPAPKVLRWQVDEIERLVKGLPSQ